MDLSERLVEERRARLAAERDSTKWLVSANAAWLAPLQGKVIAPDCPDEEIIRYAAETVIDLGEDTPDDFVARMMARLEGDRIEPVTLELLNRSWVGVQETPRPLCRQSLSRRRHHRTDADLGRPRRSARRLCPFR